LAGLTAAELVLDGQPWPVQTSLSAALVGTDAIFMEETVVAVP
jgi:hypothetical protein